MKRILLLAVFGCWLGLSAQTTAPFTQDFTGTSIPTGWTNTSSSTSANANWKFSGTPGNPSFTSSSYVPAISLDHTGNGSGIAWSDGSSPAVADCGLMTDSIDISSLTSLFFELWYYSNNVTNAGDNNKLYVNFYDGTAWNDSVWSFKGDVTQWSYAGIDLSSYTTSGKVVFEIVVDQTTAGTAFYNDIMIDDVSVKNVPPCPQPLGLSVTNVASTTADVSWGSVTAASNGYDVIHGLAGFNPASAGTVTAVTTGTTTSLSGLAGATTYDVYVVADCAANGTSDTTGPTQFITACVPFTAPYTNSFDTDALDAPPFCWEDYKTNAGSFVEVEDFTFTSAPYAGPRALYLYSSFSTTSDSLWAVTPEFTDLTGGDKQINFFMNSDDPVSQLWVGTTSSQTSKTVNWIDTLPNLVPDTYAEYIVEFTTANGYNGTDTYIVLAHNMGGTFDYIRIDEFVYEDIPPCPKPTAPAVTWIGTDSVNISVSGLDTSVDVEWGPTGFTQGTGCNANVSPNGNTLELGNSAISGSCNAQLAPGMTYDFYVRNNCTASSNGTSVWIGPITLTTVCTETAPYSQNFDGTTAPELDNCWLGVNTTNTSSAYVRVNGFTNNSAPNSVQMYNFNATSGQIALISPLLTDLDNTKRIGFRFNKTTSAVNSDLIIGTMTNRYDVSTFVAYDTIFDNELTGSFAWDEFFVDFANYTGGAAFVVFVHGQNTTFDNIYIDDFIYETKPACDPPLLGSITSTRASASEIDVKWDTSGNAFTYVEWGLVGFTPGTGSIGRVQRTGLDSTYTITGLSAQTTYDIYLQDSCTASGLSSFVGPLSVTTACQITSQYTLPFNEGFENYSSNELNSKDFCETGYYWSYIQDDEGDGELNFEQGALYYNNGSKAASLDRGTGPFKVVTHNLILTIDLSSYAGGGSDIEFGFSHMGHSNAGFPNNRVWVRGADTAAWIEVVNLDASKTAGTYVDETGILLRGTLLGNGQDVSSSTQIRFGQEGSSSIFNATCCAGYSLDDVYLVEQSCASPSFLSASNVSDTAATLKWNVLGAGGNREVWFGPQGFYQGTATTGGALTNLSVDSLVVDTLSSNSCYEYLVRRVCSNGDTSAYSGPYTFCTPCSPFTAGHTEGFETSTVNEVPDCWTELFVGATANFYAFDAYSFGLPRTGSNHLRFYNYNATSAIGSSPYYGDITAGDKRVIFYARTSTTVLGGNELVMGTISDPTDENSFTAMDTFELTNTDQKVIVNITTANGYNGTDRYVAFKHTGANFRTYYIDDYLYETIPSCPEPLFLTVDRVDTNNAIVSWDGGGSNYEIEYGTDAFGSANNTRRLISTGSSDSLFGLADGAGYCFWVREICAVGDTSIWSDAVCFLTECQAKSAPYYTGFETAVPRLGNQPVCWVEYFSGGTSPTGPSFETWDLGTIDFGSQHARLYNFNADTIMGISPKFKDMTDGDKRVTFLAQTTTTIAGNTLIVGTVASPSDPGSFDPVDTITLVGANTNTKFFVELTTANGYNGTHQYVALYHGNNGSFRTYYIDEFNYEDIPACPEPQNLNIFASTATSLSMTWDVGSATATNWIVEYGASPFTPGSGTIVNSTNDTATVSGLMSNTEYCFRVAEICPGGADTSYYTFVQCAGTDCTPFTAPYFEDFENATVGHFDGTNDCWTVSSNNPQTTASGGYSWEVRNSAQTTSVGTGPDRDNTLAPAIGGKFYTADVSGSSGFVPDSTILTSPIIDITGLSNPQLEYFYHRFGTQMADLFVDVYDGTSWTRGVHTFTNVNGINTSVSDPYKDTTISLSAYSSANFKVRFRLESNGCCTGDVAIDDIRISDPITCPAPSGLTLDTLIATSADLSWDTVGTSATSWIVEYGSAGFALGSGTTMSATTNSATLSNLTFNGNLCNEAVVYGICAGGDTSFATGRVKICGPVIPCDDFEAYSVGALGNVSSLVLPWAGAAGDAEISTAQANSGLNSLHIYDSGPAGYSDAVAVIDPITTGIWKVSTAFYIPTGSGGYYNLLHSYTGAVNVWAVDVYLNSNGTAEIQAGTNGSPVGSVLGTYSFNMGAWNTVDHIIDLDNDTAYVEINGNSTTAGWQWSLGSTNFGNQFNAMNFYSASVAGQTPNIYFDDFCVTPLTSCPAPTALAVSNAACSSIDLEWTSTSTSSVVEYGPAGFTPGTGTMANATSPYSVSGLMANTSYQFYVADTCGSDTSAFAGPFAFTTANGPQPVASFTYSSTYNASTQIVSFDASGSTNGTTYDWDHGNGNSSNGVNTTETYPLPNGSYTVTLIVSNDCGSDTATQIINTNIGLIEPDFAQSMSIFPNPSKDVFNLEFEKPNKGHIGIEIVNAAGQVVFSDDLGEFSGSYSEQIDMSEMAPGMYMLRVNSDEGVITRRLNKI